MSRYTEKHTWPAADVHLHDGTKSKATPICGATTGSVVGEVVDGDCPDCLKTTRSMTYRCCNDHGERFDPFDCPGIMTLATSGLEYVCDICRNRCGSLVHPQHAPK